MITAYMYSYNVLSECNKPFLLATVRPWAANRPPPYKGNFVHYNFLNLHYIRSKMTHVYHLAVGGVTV